MVDVRSCVIYGIAWNKQFAIDGCSTWTKKKSVERLLSIPQSFRTSKTTLFMRLLFYSTLFLFPPKNKPWNKILIEINSLRESKAPKTSFNGDTRWTGLAYIPRIAQSNKTIVVCRPVWNSRVRDILFLSMKNYYELLPVKQ